MGSTGGGTTRVGHATRDTNDVRTHHTPETTDEAPRDDRQPSDPRRAEPNASLQLLPKAGATQERRL